MTKIKVCGLMTIADIDAVNKYQPDFAGFIFAGGRHHIDLEQAIKLRHHLNQGIISVGVFVNAPIEEMLQAFDSGAVSVIQLHGNESEDVVNRLQSEGIKVIQVFKMPTDKKLVTNANYLMVDSGSGNGGILDWKNLKVTPDILAGAIDINNVYKAINIVKPKIIDVSRGVETDGKKDIDKINELVTEVHKF